MDDADARHTSCLICGADIRVGEWNDHVPACAKIADSDGLNHVDRLPAGFEYVERRGVFRGKFGGGAEEPPTA
jgi:hypothetical protein